MEPRPVPNVVADMIDIEVVSVRPPKGCPPDQCGTATMAKFLSEFMGVPTPVYMSYYQPTQDELKLLNEGAYVGIQMVSGVVPHSLHVQPNE